MSVQEARQILGSSYDMYPDEVIERIVENLETIAEAFIDTFRES